MNNFKYRFVINLNDKCTSKPDQKLIGFRNDLINENQKFSSFNIVDDASKKNFFYINMDNVVCITCFDRSNK